MKTNDKTETPITLNMNTLLAMAQQNPEYSKMLAGLYHVDELIKKFVADEVDRITDGTMYYIKTEIMNQVYNLYLFNAEVNATVGFTWVLADFLTKCQTKMIENEVIKVTRVMVKRLNNGPLKKGTNVTTWISLE